ncbi:MULTISPECIES: DUF305 domain-containing protein [Microbacterium]|uniref:DUF305 domain-containing protein n=1 Tax=Microbacterium TaxID=33882 RepID=UPI0003DE0464|nr:MULTISPECIES: DUF305 domain-containing protein [Microbacterium]CDK01729.1 conserved exported hypothetical protein [Microbacterium sp. C448]
MRTRSTLLAAGTVATALFLAGCTGTSMDGMDGMNGNEPSTGMSAEATDVDFNDADVSFAMEMIMHHQQAIEMSDVLLAKDDVAPEVISLAERIKASQQPEIDTMNGWLASWGRETMGSMGSMDSMGGMMSEEDMTALEDASGPAASSLFLEQMIVHHEGAIEMAQAQLTDGQNPDAVELAQKIINDQTAEIAEMEQLLTQL